MPTYLPPVQGVSISEADAEAATIAPIGRVPLDTLEFWHPNFTEAARINTDKADHDLTLEADAPRNAGETVTFRSVPLSLVKPSESDDASAPKFQLAIDGVSSILTTQLDLAADTLDPVQMIYRSYMSDQPGGPSRLPVHKVEMTAVRVSETRVTASAVDDDAAGTRFPRVAYTRYRYPGLSAR